MAKKTDLDDIDSWGDFDKEFGDFNFDSNTIEPPKNKREAVTRTVKDIKKGFVSNIKDNKLKTAGLLAKNSIPKSLSKEADIAFDLARDIKSEIDEGLKDFKKHSRTTLKTVENLLPNGKVKDLVSRIKSKFGEDNTNKGPSKEQLEAELISGSINEALGAMQQQQQATEMIRQSIESKRAANTNNLLSHIYAETKFTRVFHAETTNKFYRKSLELQYKSLFIQKETLELQKAAFSGFQKQFEALISNTALPDILKSRNSELLNKDLKARFRKDMVDSLYKQFNPYDNLKKNMLNQLKGFREGMSGSFDMLNMGLESYQQMREMNEMMGISGAYNLGVLLSDFANKQVGGAIGRGISKTKYGKSAIYNTKNAFADPTSFFRSMSKKKGIGGLFGALSTLSGSAGRNTPDFLQRDLDLATPFDGRAHDSLVKVIPGLLSKIYGELKSIRGKVNPGGGPKSGDELIWDTASDSFISKGNMKSKLNKEMNAAINDRVKPLIRYILDIYTKAGVSLNGKSADAFSTAIIKYMLYRTSGLNINALNSSAFLASISDKNTINKIKSANKKLVEYCKNNPDELDNLNTYLKYIKDSIPNINSRFTDIYRQGNGDILTGLGVANTTSTGSLVYNQQGSDNFLLSNIDFSMKGVKAHRQESVAQSEKIFKSMQNKVKSAYGSTKTYIGNSYNKTKDFINKVDKDTAVNYVMTNKAKLEDFVNDDVAPVVRKNINKTHKRIRVYYRKALKEANSFLEKNPKAKEVRNMVDELKTETGDYVREAYTNRIDKNKIDIHSNNIKQISENIIKYTKGKKEPPVDKIKKIAENDSLVKTAFRDMRKLDRKIAASLPSIPGQILSGVSTTIGFTGDILGKLKQSNTYGYDGPGAQEVSYEEAKAEYMSSPEYKDGSAPTFPGWLKTMKYKVKDKKRTTNVKNAFKKMREWDRLIAGKMMKGLFKAPGAAFKVGKTGAGFASKALGGTANIMLDMLPMGLGEVIKTPFALMNKTLELVGLKEKQNDKKERAGSWLSRLNIFKKDKEVKNKKGFLGRLTTAMKENKGLTTFAILGGISALLKTMGLSLTDVVDGVKKVGSILTKGFSFISGLLGNVFGFIGKGIDKVKNFFGFGSKNEDGTDDNTAEGWGKTLGTATAAGAGLFGAGKAMKFAKIPGGGALSVAGKVLMTPGRIIVNAMWSLAKKLFSWGPVNAMPGFVEKLFKGKNGDATAKKLDKIIPTKEKVVNVFKQVENKAVKKLGKKAIGKGVAKIGVRIAASLSGVGTLVGLGLLAWDLAWIVKYMLIDGMSFLGAVSMQYFGTNIMDDEDENTMMSASADETEAGHISVTNETLSNQTGTSSGFMSSMKQASSTYNVSRSLGNTVGKSLSLATDQFSGAMSSSAEKGPYGYSGKPFKNVTAEDIAKLKIDSPAVNRSPFITPDPQKSDNNKPANIEGLKPDLKNRLYAFAEDYYKWTGQKLKVTSGLRSIQQQVTLWEKEAKVKWTGNEGVSYVKGKKVISPDGDIGRMLKAGGKCYGYGGNVAYPRKTSAHVTGSAIDLNIGEMPGQSSINAKKPTPWLDNLLYKHGLRRNLTEFNGHKGHLERWHISAHGQPQPSEESPPEPSKLPAEEKKELVGGILIGNNRPTSIASQSDIQNSSIDSISSSTGTLGSSTTSSSIGGFSSSPASYNDATTSISRDTGLSGNIDNILRNQLQIQTNTRDLIKEIRDHLLSGKSYTNQVTAANNTNVTNKNIDTTSSTLPEPKIDLRRKYATI